MGFFGEFFGAIVGSIIFRFIVYFMIFLGVVFYVHKKEHEAAVQAIAQFNHDQTTVSEKAKKEYQEEILTLNNNVIILSKDNQRLKSIARSNLSKAQKYIQAEKETIPQYCRRQMLKIFNGTLKKLKGGGIY